MSLSDALLLDPYPFEVWVAYRTDGIMGSGTASDPWDASPKYGNAIPIADLSRNGLVATATVLPAHGLANGDVVRISGVQGPGADRWNGTFVVHGADDTYTFSYTMIGEPASGQLTLTNAAAAEVLECRFDTVMKILSAQTRIHLGPTPPDLPFLTRGYADGVTGGWQPKGGMRITGAGIDSTMVRLVGSAQSGHFFAFGHALTTGAPAAPNPLDFFELSDLTIDCNQVIPAANAAACGGVRVMGNHSRVARIKAVNWGTNSVNRPCFAIAVVTADRGAGLVEMIGCGIEVCIAVQPAQSPAGAPVTVLHAGQKEGIGALAEGYGRGPFIRNCFVDGGAPGSSGELRGLSIGWCRGGVVEGNQIHNVTYGGPY